MRGRRVPAYMLCIGALKDSQGKRDAGGQHYSLPRQVQLWEFRNNRVDRVNDVGDRALTQLPDEHVRVPLPEAVVGNMASLHKAFPIQWSPILDFVT